MAVIMVERIVGHGISSARMRDLVVDWIVARKPKTVFDIGMGTGHYGVNVRKKDPEIRFIGLDVYLAYMLQQGALKEYEMHLHAPIEALMDGTLRVQADLYLLMDVVEHFEKDKALRLLRALPTPALISTPLFDYHQEAVGGNDHEKHLCWFSEEELKELGLVELFKTDHVTDDGQVGQIGAFLKE